VVATMVVAMLVRCNEEQVDETIQLFHQIVRVQVKNEEYMKN